MRNILSGILFGRAFHCDNSCFVAYETIQLSFFLFSSPKAFHLIARQLLEDYGWPGYWLSCLGPSVGRILPLKLVLQRRQIFLFCLWPKLLPNKHILILLALFVIRSEISSLNGNESIEKIVLKQINLADLLDNAVMT